MLPAFYRTFALADPVEHVPKSLSHYYPSCCRSGSFGLPSLQASVYIYVVDFWQRDRPSPLGECALQICHESVPVGRGSYQSHDGSYVLVELDQTRVGLEPLMMLRLACALGRDRVESLKFI